MGDISNATKQVIDALKPLADKLGTTAEQAYQYAVKDALISGHNQMMAVWFFAFASICFAFLFLKGLSKEWDGESMVWVVILALACAGVSIANYTAAQHYLLNPEYMGMQDLLTKIK